MLIRDQPLLRSGGEAYYHRSDDLNVEVNPAEDERTQESSPNPNSITQDKYGQYSRLSREGRPLVGIYLFDYLLALFHGDRPMGSGPIGFLEENGLTGEEHGQDREAGS